jgi:hypothetical protein
MQEPQEYTPAPGQPDIGAITPVAEPPKAGKLRPVGQLVAGTVGSIPIPVAGGVLGAAFEMMADRGLNKRRDAWENTVVTAINQLIERNKALADSEVLMTAVVKAGRIALATHQQEKLDSLRNAVLNSVAPGAPNDDDQARFFRLIDDLTQAHIVVLRFLEASGETLRGLPAARRPRPLEGSSELVRMGDLFKVVSPEIGEDQEWRDLLMYDLSTARLAVGMSSLDDNYTQLSDQRNFATGLGRRFLTFIPDSNSAR